MRAIWSGSLSFGLINIPVNIYSASEERALKFRLFDKHGNCPISYAKVCRSNNKEVKAEDIVKGYEYQKGDFVILSDDDFKKASPKKTKTIEVLNFVEEKEIPSEYIEKPYFIEPEKSAEKAYVLLREAMKKSGRVGIARFVFHNKEHLGMVKAEERALMLITLRFEEELRKPEGLKIPDKSEFSKQELDVALMLIGQLEKHFKAGEYHDTYSEELKKIIEQKAKGKPVKVSAEKAGRPTDMKNLLEILRMSLEKEKMKK